MRLRELVSLLRGSRAHITPIISLLLTCLGDLGGLMSTVIIGVRSAHEPPSRASGFWAISG